MFERFAKNKTIRFTILSIFLLLISISSSVIIIYTYTQNAKSFRSLYSLTIKQVSTIIYDKIDCLIAEIQRVPQLADYFFKNNPDPVAERKQTVGYLLETLKYHRVLQAIFFGTPDGNGIVVYNLSLTYHPEFFRPQKQTPPGAAYAYMLADGSNKQESWVYLDKEMQVLSSEDVPLQYDPRTRPWYLEAVKNGKLFWSDIFRVVPSTEKAVSISSPVFDPTSGKLIGVVGAALPLYFFSEFLTANRIGKEETTVILSHSGEIILPDEKNQEIEKVAQSVFLQYSQHKKSDFLITENRKEYLISVHPFPQDFGNDWLIVTIDPLLDFFSEIIANQHRVIVISLIIFALASLLVVFSSNLISAPIRILAHEVDKITNFELESEKRVQSNILEIFLLDHSIAALRHAIRSFSRYVPKEVVKSLISQGKETILGGEKKEVTVLFSDIESFTSVAEKFPVETTMSLLAEYFDLLSKIILAEHGTIDKYIGDAIMAMWGVPEFASNHAELACIAALKCQAAIQKLNQRRKETNLPEFRTRIGINTGEVIVGNIGTSERMNYTLIGDAVNLAERLEATNKIYHTHIIVSEHTYLKIADLFVSRPLDIVEVKGKKEKTKIFELLGAIGKEEEIRATPDDLALAASFTKAFDAFQSGDLKAAKALFQQLHKQYPLDIPTNIYLNRLKNEK